MDLEQYKKAKNDFLSGDFAFAEKFFGENNLWVEFGYCKMLSGDIETAEKAFSKVSSYDFRGDWGKKLLQFIRGYVSTAPTYFQIRNFLEIDLNLLIKAGRADYVENIINGADLFYSINPESYKFIARVMQNNDFVDIALYYLDKAKEKFYSDPEMHFMLANCYIKKGDKALAKESIQNCLSILPNYFPARKLLDEI